MCIKPKSLSSISWDSVLPVATSCGLEQRVVNDVSDQWRHRLSVCVDAESENVERSGMGILILTKIVCRHFNNFVPKFHWLCALCQIHLRWRILHWQQGAKSHLQSVRAVLSVNTLVIIHVRIGPMCKKLFLAHRLHLYQAQDSNIVKIYLYRHKVLRSESNPVSSSLMLFQYPL